MTIRDLLQKATKGLALSSTARLDAELLLAHALKQSREYLVMHAEKEPSKPDEKLFEGLLKERQSAKPVAYLIHEKEFYGRKFYVDERVLIPRPETELMIEEALKFLTSRPALHRRAGNQQTSRPVILDLGTGSGCLAITMALERPDLEVIGLDISKDALEVAKKNAELLGCKNVKFVESDLLLSLREAKRRSNLVILANLPYIGTETNRFISEETHRFEPHLATYGVSGETSGPERRWPAEQDPKRRTSSQKYHGFCDISDSKSAVPIGNPDGLELYRRMFQQIKDIKLNVSAMFMEIGFSQKEAMEKEARTTFPTVHFEIKNDLAGLARMAILTK